MDSPQIKFYKHLAPKIWFGLRTCPENEQHSQAGSPYKPIFVALGDSFTCGSELPYNQVWPSIITQKLGWGHINLAWRGSSIENLTRMLQGSLQVQDVPHMAMITYPWRGESNKWYLHSDRSRRIKHSQNTLAEQVDKIRTLLEQFPNVWFSTVWGYPNDLRDACSLLEKEFPNFKQNPIDWLDRAGPDGHAGPDSHQAFANFLIKEFFDKVNK